MYGWLCGTLWRVAMGVVFNDEMELVVKVLVGVEVVGSLWVLILVEVVAIFW